jgi:hypothetical protein
VGERPAGRGPGRGDHRLTRTGPTELPFAIGCAAAGDGRLVEEWDRARTTVRADVPGTGAGAGAGAGAVESWIEVGSVRPGLVSFRQVFAFAADGTVLTSESTLRFRTRDELTASVAVAGLVVEDVREAPDRPGRELVLLTRRPG